MIQQIDADLTKPISLALDPQIEASAVEQELKDIPTPEITVNPKFNTEGLKEEIDLALSSSKGSEHLSSIDKLVDAIKGMVEKIERKLPMQALSY